MFRCDPPRTALGVREGTSPLAKQAVKNSNTLHHQETIRIVDMVNNSQKVLVHVADSIVSKINFGNITGTVLRSELVS